jgi:hypothetical protein
MNRTLLAFACLVLAGCYHGEAMIDHGEAGHARNL